MPKEPSELTAWELLQEYRGAVTSNAVSNILSCIEDEAKCETELMRRLEEWPGAEDIRHRNGYLLHGRNPQKV